MRTAGNWSRRCARPASENAARGQATNVTFSEAVCGEEAEPVEAADDVLGGVDDDLPHERAQVCLLAEGALELPLRTGAVRARGGAVYAVGEGAVEGVLGARCPASADERGCAALFGREEVHELVQDVFVQLWGCLRPLSHVVFKFHLPCGR